MIKEIVEKLNKKVSKEEYNIIKNIILKYFEDGRKYRMMPFTYIKDFGAKRLQLSRQYTSGGAIWVIISDNGECGANRILPSFDISKLIEGKPEKFEKFLQKLISKYPKTNICSEKEWEEFIKKLI